MAFPRCVNRRTGAAFTRATGASPVTPVALSRDYDRVAAGAWPGNAPLSHTSFFLFCWVALAALLFLPVSRLIWVMSVRRIERRRGSALPETERGAQLRRARVLAVLVVLAFSFLFNLQTLGPSGG